MMVCNNRPVHSLSSSFISSTLLVSFSIAPFSKNTVSERERERERESGEMGEESNSRDLVVMYPSPGMGHLLPMVELARVLVGRNRLLDVTILVHKPYFDTVSTEAFVSSVMGSNPLISFHLLPPVDLSHFPKRFIESLFGLIRLSKPNVELFMSSLHPLRPLAFVVDDFCAGSTEIATQLGVPAYIFYTGCAAGLAVFLHLPTIHSLTTQNFKDMGTSLVHFPEIPPIPADHMPPPLLDREDRAYQGFLHLSIRMAEADGIIVNTFDSLEGKTIQSLGTTGAFTRTIYSVGPLIISDGGQAQGEGDYYFKWLDMQPKGSVVFLCFGSMGTFSPEQLEEIANGLERSQQRFLWVVKNPPSQEINSEKYSTTHVPPEPDLDFLLPKGFLDRTQDRGLVVKSWASQVAVLRHEAVGGFVTHLGWNSVLEAICAGVGMIGWPLYAEQRMNKVFVVDDMRLAIAMEGYDKELVTAAEVERSVREMMMEESEVGAGVKERCSAMKHAAEVTVGDGGASMLALDELVRDWRIRKKSKNCVE